MVVHRGFDLQDGVDRMGQALRTAILAENGVNGDIFGKLASVVRDGTSLTLTGTTAPITDAAAPTFTVDSATVDTNGVQQVSKVTYSNNNADFYTGGKLSVVIAGQTVTADMVAGAAAALGGGPAVDRSAAGPRQLARLPARGALGGTRPDLSRSRYAWGLNLPAPQPS